METVKLELYREEALALIIIVEVMQRRNKSFGWADDACKKLLDAMGLAPQEGR